MKLFALAATHLAIALALMICTVPVASILNTIWLGLLLTAFGQNYSNTCAYGALVLTYTCYITIVSVSHYRFASGRPTDTNA